MASRGRPAERRRRREPRGGWALRRAPIQRCRGGRPAQPPAVLDPKEATLRQALGGEASSRYRAALPQSLGPAQLMLCRSDGSTSTSAGSGCRSGRRTAQGPLGQEPGRLQPHPLEEPDFRAAEGAHRGGREGLGRRVGAHGFTFSVTRFRGRRPGAREDAARRETRGRPRSSRSRPCTLGLARAYRLSRSAAWCRRDAAVQDLWKVDRTTREASANRGPDPAGRATRSEPFERTSTTRSGWLRWLERLPHEGGCGCAPAGRDRLRSRYAQR